MRKYFKNTEDMSLDEKISWVINKVPYILLNDMNIDISDVNNVTDNNGDTLCILESEYNGDYAAKKAIDLAIKLLNTDISLLKSTDSILIMLTLSPNHIFEGDDPLDVICFHVPYESPITLGTSKNDTFSEKHVKATIVFAGSKPIGK